MRLWIVVLFLGLSVLCASTFAADSNDLPKPLQPVEKDADNISFPYKAQIAGSDVHIRSGSGLNYYSCGKLSTPGEVIVVGKRFSWLQILPPPGSFSWISKQYVKFDPAQPGLGIITGDNVQIWAGSDLREPIRSDSRQRKLNTGAKVRLLDEEKGGYYKIAPPQGAYLWISAEYTQFLEAIDPDDFGPLVKPPQDDQAETPAVVASSSTVKSKRLQEYQKLAAKIEIERVKPIEEQDYKDIRKGLSLIVGDAKAGKAAKYAKILIGRIDRFELAKKANQQLKSQRNSLSEKLKQIEEERKEKLAGINQNWIFAVTGVFEASMIYSDKTGLNRGIIADEKGAPICYAEPVGLAAKINLDGFLRKKVSLIGQISADPQSNLALVRFTEIVLAK